MMVKGEYDELYKEMADADYHDYLQTLKEEEAEAKEAGESLKECVVAENALNTRGYLVSLIERKGIHPNKEIRVDGFSISFGNIINFICVLSHQHQEQVVNIFKSKSSTVRYFIVLARQINFAIKIKKLKGVK